MTQTVTDPYCKRNADEIPGLQARAIKRGVHPNDLAAADVTFNPKTRQFACDECFGTLGMPEGWKAGTPVKSADAPVEMPD